MNIDYATLNTICLRIADTLVHFLWQGAALALAAGLAMLLMRRASARSRYALLLTLFALTAASPVATFTLLTTSPDTAEWVATTSASVLGAVPVPNASTSPADPTMPESVAASSVSALETVPVPNPSNLSADQGVAASSAPALEAVPVPNASTSPADLTVPELVAASGMPTREIVDPSDASSRSADLTVPPTSAQALESETLTELAPASSDSALEAEPVPNASSSSADQGVPVTSVSALGAVSAPSASTSPADPTAPELVPSSSVSALGAAAFITSIFAFTADFTQSHAPTLALAYALGVTLMLLRLTWAVRGGRRLRRACLRVDDPTLLEQLREQARLLGMRAAPVVAYCERVAVPTVVGILRPMVLLPLFMATGFTPQQLELILRHELAHIARYDHIINLAQRLVEAFLFFHPGVWFISRMIRIEREHCCDDLVLATGGEALAYADSLVRIAERGLGKEPLTAVAMASRPSDLRRRIIRLLEGPAPHVRFTRIGLLLTLMLLIGTGAAIHAATREQATLAEKPAASTSPPAIQSGPFSDIDIEIDGQTMDLGDGVYVLAFMTTTCDRCKEAVVALNELAAQPSTPRVIALMTGEPGELEQFRVETAPAFSMHLLDTPTWMNLLDDAPEPPRFVLVRDGLRIASSNEVFSSADIVAAIPEAASTTGEPTELSTPSTVVATPEQVQDLPAQLDSTDARLGKVAVQEPPEQRTPQSPHFIVAPKESIHPNSPSDESPSEVAPSETPARVPLYKRKRGTRENQPPDASAIPGETTTAIQGEEPTVYPADASDLDYARVKELLAKKRELESERDSSAREVEDMQPREGKSFRDWVDQCSFTVEGARNILRNAQANLDEANAAAATVQENPGASVNLAEVEETVASSERVKRALAHVSSIAAMFDAEIKNKKEDSPEVAQLKAQRDSLIAGLADAKSAVRQEAVHAIVAQRSAAVEEAQQSLDAAGALLTEAHRAMELYDSYQARLQGLTDQLERVTSQITAVKRMSEAKRLRDEGNYAEAVALLQDALWESHESFDEIVALILDTKRAGKLPFSKTELDELKRREERPAAEPTTPQPPADSRAGRVPEIAGAPDPIHLTDLSDQSAKTTASIPDPSDPSDPTDPPDSGSSAPATAATPTVANTTPAGAAISDEFSELHTQLQTNDPWLLQVAVQQIGDFKNPAFVPQLSNLLLAETAAVNVKVAAAEALGKIGGPDVLRPLVAALRYQEVQRFDGKGEIAQAAVRALTGLGQTPDSLALLRYAATEINSPLCSNAHSVLAAYGTQEALGVIIESLTSYEEEDGPIDAGAVLAKFSPEVSVPVLLRAFNEGTLSQQIAAAYALAAIDRPEVNDALAAALPRMPDDVRDSATAGLGTRQDEASIALLTQALHDPAFHVRTRAAEALRERRFVPPDTSDVAAYQTALRNWYVLPTFGAAALEPLVNALSAKDSESRDMAASILSVIEDPAAVAPLIHALQDPEGGVRSMAAVALGTIGDAAAVPALIQALSDSEARYAAAESLGQIGDRSAVPALVTSLKDMDSRMYTAAANALGAIGDPQAIAPLVEALNVKSQYRDHEFVGVVTDNLRKLAEQHRDQVIAALPEPLPPAPASPAPVTSVPPRRPVRPSVRMDIDPTETLRSLAEELRAAQQTDAPATPEVESQAREPFDFKVELGPLAGPPADEEASSEAVPSETPEPVPLYKRPGGGPKASSDKSKSESPTSLSKTPATEPKPSKEVELLKRIEAKQKEAKATLEMQRYSDEDERQKAMQAEAAVEMPANTEPSDPSDPTDQTDPSDSSTPPAVPMSPDSPQASDQPDAAESSSSAYELITQLGDGDWWLRQIAAQQLGELNDIDPKDGRFRVSKLIEALKDEDPRVQAAAADALGKVGDPNAIKHLVAALKEKEPVRAAAADALAKFDPAQTLDLLKRAINDTQNLEVRVGAVAALQRMPAEISVPLFVATLRAMGTTAGGDVEFVDAIQGSLISIPSDDFAFSAMVKLAHEGPEVASGVAVIVLSAWNTEESHRAVLEVAQNPNAPTRVAAVSLLGGVRGDEATNVLVALLKDSDWSIRAQAAQVLQKRNYFPESPEDRARFYVPLQQWDIVRSLGNAAIEPLIAALGARVTPQSESSNMSEEHGNDIQYRLARVVPRRRADAGRADSANVPVNAAMILAEMNAREAIEPMIGLMKHNVAVVRIAAAAALQIFNDPLATPVLIEALRDADSNVRYNAILALRRLHTPEAVTAIVTAVQDPDADVRRIAIWSVGELKSVEAVDALARATKDVAVDPKKAAIASLAAIGTPPAVEAIAAVLSSDPEPSWRRFAAEQLAETGPTAVPHLVQALSDDDEEVRQSAANALGEVATPAAAGAVTPLLDPEHAESTRIAAVWALAELGSGVPHLIEALDDPSEQVRLAAIHALGKIGDPAAADALAKFVGLDQDVDWQYAATEALSKLGPAALPHLERIVQQLGEGAYNWPQDSKNAAKSWLLGLQRQQKATLGR